MARSSVLMYAYFRNTLEHFQIKHLYTQPQYPSQLGRERCLVRILLLLLFYKLAKAYQVIFIASRVYEYSQIGIGGGWERRRREIQIKEATAGIIISKLPQCI